MRTVVNSCQLHGGTTESHQSSLRAVFHLVKFQSPDGSTPCSFPLGQKKKKKKKKNDQKKKKKKKKKNKKEE